MAEIILWNSIARRRRSISDTFYDNGLATLRSYLEERGHQVEIVDWARDDFFQSLSPFLLTKILRTFYIILFKIRVNLFRKIVGGFLVYLQEILDFFQKVRIKRRMRQLANYVKKRRVYIFGAKLWYGEAFQNAQYLIKLIKKIAPEIITIAGGYHDTLYEEHLLKTCDFDLGAVCEGEFPLEKILEIVEKYKNNWRKEEVLREIIQKAESGNINNLVYRDKDRIKKTKRRLVDVYSSKSIPHYTLDENKVRIHVMVESLGCDWARCNFCVHPYFYPHYSLRDPEEIITEIKEMVKIGIGIFRFAGSDTPPYFGAKIAQKIIDHRLKIIFGMGSRAIKGAKEKFTTLVNSYSTLIKGGLRAVFMGGECGNDFINHTVMNKGIGFEDIVFTISALREAERKVGIKVYLSLALIYPPPLMGRVTLKEVKEDNLRLLEKTRPDSVMITPPGPFLHTRWYEEKEKFGFKLEEGLLERAMRYEYVLYKPPQLWPPLGIYLDGKPFKKILEECGDFRKKVESKLAIPTDISDEHFLMFYAAGIRSKEEILLAKRNTLLDIISCNYTLTRKIGRLVNSYSKELAKESLAHIQT